MPTYSRSAIVLHWLIGLLVIANLVSGFTGLGFFVHKAIGITVLVLTLVWMALSLSRRSPPLPADVSGWQRGAAKAAHGLLYVFCIAMPLLGWLMVSNSETLRPLTWFGLFDIPYLTVNAQAGEIGHDGHVLLAIPFALLAVIHIAAALKHHFVNRNEVLTQMAPAIRPRT